MQRRTTALTLNLEPPPHDFVARRISVAPPQTLVVAVRRLPRDTAGYRRCRTAEHRASGDPHRI
jgi:hypothetical protein